MWRQDEGENGYSEASGFIRIAVHPTWSPEYFADVKLNRIGAATVVFYTLPKGAKTMSALLKRELKRNPCADAKSLAKILPIQRRTVAANQRIKDLINNFFSLRWEPRPIPTDIVRLDAAEYELEYVGDDTLLFDSDDHETAMVKWVDSFFNELYGAAR